MVRKYSSYILCLLISFFVVALYVNNFSPLAGLERKVNDMLYSFRGEQKTHSDIVLINIDDAAVAKYGQWPWHRDRIADLVAAVGTGNPKTVFLDLVFEPDTDEDTLGYTNILAGQMSWVKNVIIPYQFNRADFRNARISRPDYLYDNAITINTDLGILDEYATIMAQNVFLPPKQLCQYSAGIGFRYNIYDSDRKVRWQPLVMFYDGFYYPSASLLAAANYKGYKPSQITVQSDGKVFLGNREIPVNHQTCMFVNYNKPKQSFLEFSATDILDESINLESLANKLVIISLTSTQLTDYYRTPVSKKLAGSEIRANVMENIIHSNFIHRYDSPRGLDMLILFALGGLFAFILPRVSLKFRFIILFISLFILANVTFILFNSYSILYRTLYIALEIFLLLIASPFLESDLLERLASKKDSSGKKSGWTGPPKVHLDDTPSVTPHPTKPPVASSHAGSTRTTKETVKMDYDTGRGKSSLIEKTAANNYANVQKTEAFSTTPPPSAGQSQPSGNEHDFKHVEHNNINIDHDQDHGDESENYDNDSSGIDIVPDSQKIKQLGRYQVDGVLGKGAMGTVYKGMDPAINRNVALKTIRLDFVNDPEELAELKERLFREAQAAGNLSHPNIVTIYDVGTEKNLQYIAMEYLQGQTLEDLIRKKTKMNYRIISQIISQICTALDYAHSQGIVHRDIKPANIMILADFKVKVMDFGIARVDSSSMTRTGIAMGTPNYISPEQLSGKKIDRRTDIFSLGVVMYEMLLQRRPFRGENLTSLIYNIVNNDPEPPSSIDSSIPGLFDRVIAKALAKDPDARYQSAGEISVAISDFIDSFGAKKSV